MRIPTSLLEAHSKLGFDERGIIPVIRIADFHATGAFHVIRLWGEPAGYRAKDFFGDVVYYAFYTDVGSDPVVTVLPPTGTQVWQWNQRGIWRTSRIRRYASAVAFGPWNYHAILEPAGPLAGIPVSGDSGSICWVRVDGKWMVLGVVSHPSGVFVARPRKVPHSWAVVPVEIPEGADEANPFPEATIAELTAPWVEPEPVSPDQATPNPQSPAPTPPAPTPNPLLIEVPDGVTDAMSPHAVAPNGHPDQVVDVPWDGNLALIESIRVLGLDGDEWRWRDTGHWWHIRAQQQPGRLFLRMAQSKPTDKVTVEIVRRSSSNPDDGIRYPWTEECQVIAPVAPTPAPNPEPPSAPSTSELDAMRVQVAELRAALDKATKDVEFHRGIADKLAKDLGAARRQIERDEELRDTLEKLANLAGWRTV